MVVVELMSSHLISSHVAAGNFGRWPHNGSERYVTTREWAEEVMAGRDYDHIVRDATPADLEEHDELPESW